MTTRKRYGGTRKRYGGSIIKTIKNAVKEVQDYKHKQQELQKYKIKLQQEIYSLIDKSPKINAKILELTKKQNIIISKLNNNNKHILEISMFKILGSQYDGPKKKSINLLLSESEEKKLNNNYKIIENKIKELSNLSIFIANKLKEKENELKQLMKK